MKTKSTPPCPKRVTSDEWREIARDLYELQHKQWNKTATASMELNRLNRYKRLMARHEDRMHWMSQHGKDVVGALCSFDETMAYQL
jgi:hypothetical protein